MPILSSSAPGVQSGVSRPIVVALFAATCLLSVVSWYTTQQGMALYLSGWFSLLASLGVQVALVMVAWLVGFTRTRRALLISVYVITATVSIAFSYVSLYTWFSAKERPAAVSRRLYDALYASSGKAQELLASAAAEAEKHSLALQEMTSAEREHGYISRAVDADPYLARIREAVAREAITYSPAYQEGVGPGLRYTAFDRYASIARQTLERVRKSQETLAEFRQNLKPLDPTENQLRAYRQAFDSVPWSEVRETLHSDRFELPAVPAYSEFVDRSASGQEDLIIAFSELLTAPTNRHIFAFALAAFIDIIVFLLAYASGPFFFGAPEERWFVAGASLDSADNQVFLRGFLRKFVPGPEGLARVNAATLSPGEQQLCVLLAARGLAAQSREEDRIWFVFDPSVHQQMFESLAAKGLHLRASPQSALN